MGMTRRSPVLIASAAALCCLALATGAAARPGNAPRPAGASDHVEVGQPPPALDLARISGTEAITLEGLSGHVVVLDFWATWCGPCRAVAPYLDAMYRRHRARGLSVVGLSPEPDALIRQFIASRPVDYTIARDVGQTVRTYGVRGIPTIVVLDRSGQVRDVMVGVDGSSLSRLDSLVEQLLREPTPAGP
jgi:thiol-disulfide isomerase/thioredoxin